MHPTTPLIVTPGKSPRDTPGGLMATGALVLVAVMPITEPWLITAFATPVPPPPAHKTCGRFVYPLPGSLRAVPAARPFACGAVPVALRGSRGRGTDP